MWGDKDNAALYRRVNLEGVRFRRVFNEPVNLDRSISRQQIADAITSGIVDPTSLLSYPGSDKIGGIRYVPDEDHVNIIECLRAIATAARIYSYLPDATAALSIVNHGPLTKAQWYLHESNDVLRPGSVDTDIELGILLPPALSRRATFACISMFESGGLDLDPGDLHRVMALSAGDSIYVSAPILCDPAIHREPFEVTRIVGNIGRPGMAFLIPPSDPRVRQPRLESYEVINHDLYGGKREDCFQNTSLHLGFSGYEFALDVGDHGTRGREAFFLETMISVHDKGEWVADVDVLSVLDSFYLYHTSKQRVCNHSASDHSHHLSSPIVAIDRWEELLERPRSAGIVRAYGNWAARLAAAAVSIQMDNPTILLSGNECWNCEKKVQRHNIDSKGKPTTSLYIL